MKRLISPLFALLLLLIASPSVLAAPHATAVLGSNVDTKDVNFPPVSAGPGMILPDSPLYFLDGLKQSVKVALSGSSLNRANTHTEIIGERMAELRIMLSRGNRDGVTRALDNLAYEAREAASNLADASSQGQNVSESAKKLNSTLKLDREALLKVENQLSGGLASQFAAARTNLMEAKLVAENNLSKEDGLNEAKDDLAETIDANANLAAKSAQTLENALLELSKTVTNQAADVLLEKQDAVKKAALARNQTLVKKLTLELEAEKKRQDAILSAQNKALGDLKIAADNLQKAAVSIGNFQAVRLNPEAAVAGASTTK